MPAKGHLPSSGGMPENDRFREQNGRLMSTSQRLNRTAFVLFREHGKDAALETAQWAEAWLG